MLIQYGLVIIGIKYIKMENPKRMSTLITKKQPNILARTLSTIDVFKFIPVPKDRPVSTKYSIAGSLLFIVIFVGFVLFDFITFVTFNKPIAESYIESLDSQSYGIPDFALAFMTTKEDININNYTQIYDNLFTYQWSVVNRQLGKNITNEEIQKNLVTYNNSTPNNFDKISWMSEKTKKFYYILRTPVKKDLQSYGLQYSTPKSQYIKIKASFCLNGSQITCLPQQNMTYLSNYGRFFLFIQNQIDNSSVSLEKDFDEGDNYLLYNFFVVPNYYKRINIKLQVVKTQILPDFFFRWSTEKNTRIQVQSVFEETSVTNTLDPTNTDAIVFNMMLAPYIVRNRISYSTIIDHVSQWGALFGVLFSVFGIIFLSFNRQKFYKKNPNWSKFKNALKQGIIDPKPC